MVNYEAWESTGHRPTERLTFQERTRRILIEHALSIAPDLGGMVERGEGREIIGTVEGREDEDLEVLIDKMAQEKTEESFRVLGEKYGMSFFVFSEHHNFMVGQGEPEFFAALDPTENSDEYAKGNDTPLYHVTGFWGRDGNPLGAVCIDLSTKSIFINLDGKNFELKQKTGELIPFSPTPRVESISDRNFIWASYVGKSKYHKFVHDNLQTLDEHRNKHSSFHGKGGSHIYARAARNGTMYVMGIEPVSELAPGAAFTISENFTIVSVGSDGTREPFKFDPMYYYQNPDAYKTDRIPLLVVAPTSALANEVIHEAFLKRLPGFD